MILGIDEAGRGPWAGPLVVGAVVLGGVEIEGLTDSKKLTKKKRELLYEEVVSRARSYASGWVTARELDTIGMSEALRLATRRAVEQIKVPYSEIIIDGTINFLSGTGKGDYVQTLPKADLLVPSVSAASIIAKVERDRYMDALEGAYPHYGFGSHAGYGVAKHRAAIDAFGVTPEHRLSFAPLAKYAALPSVPVIHKSEVRRVDEPAARTTKRIGDEAERVVAEFLETNGHSIIERNWRTKYCEIDIVSQKNATIFFVEVKHRKNDTAGGGMAYITAKKLKQMQFAAKVYAHGHSVSSVDMRLAAAATTGSPPQVVDFIEII
jgi:ribonuclease HII